MGTASKDPRDQHPTIIIIQDGGFRQREGSVIPDLRGPEFAARDNGRIPASRGKERPAVPKFPGLESSTRKHRRESEELDDHTGLRKRSRTHRSSSSQTFDDQGHALSIEHDQENDGMQVFEDAPEASGPVVQNSQGSLRPHIATAGYGLGASNADADVEPKSESPDARNTIWNLHPSVDLEESAARSVTPQAPPWAPAQLQRRSISRRYSSNLEHQGTFQNPRGSVPTENPTVETDKRKTVILKHAPQQPMTPPSDVSNRDRGAMPTSVLTNQAPRTKSSSTSTNASSNRFKKAHKDIYQPTESDIEDSQMSPNSSRMGKARRSTSGEASRKKSIKIPIMKRPGLKDVTDLIDSGGQITDETRHRNEPIYDFTDPYEVMSDMNDLTYRDTEDERPSETGERLPRDHHHVGPKTSAQATDLRNAQVSHQFGASDDSTTQMGSWRHTPSNKLESRAEPGDMELPDAEPTLLAPPSNRIKKKVTERLVSVDIPATAKSGIPVRLDVEKATTAPDEAATSKNTTSETSETGMMAGDRAEWPPTKSMHDRNTVMQQAQPATPRRKRRRKTHLIEHDTPDPVSRQGSSAPGLPKRDASFLEMPQGNPKSESATISPSNSSSGAQLEHDLKASNQDTATTNIQPYAKGENLEKVVPATLAVQGEIYTGVIDGIHPWGVMVALTGLIGKPLGLVPAKLVQDGGEWNKSSNRLRLSQLVTVEVLRIQDEKITLTMQGLHQPIEADEEESEPLQSERNISPLQGVKQPIEYDEVENAPLQGEKAIKAPQQVSKSGQGRGIWTPKSNRILMQARDEGLSWVEIQERNFPNRTADACRSHYYVVQQRASRGSTDSDQNASKTSSDIRPPENIGAGDNKGVNDEIERDIVKLPYVDDKEARLGLGITDTPPKLRKSTSSAVDPVPLNLSTAASQTLREKPRATSASNVRTDDSSKESSMSHRQTDKSHPRTDSKLRPDAITPIGESTHSLWPNKQAPSAGGIASSKKNRETSSDHGQAGQNPILPPGLTHEEYQKRRSKMERKQASTQAPGGIQYTRNDPSEQQKHSTTKKSEMNHGQDASGTPVPRREASTNNISIDQKQIDKRHGKKSMIAEHAASPAPRPNPLTSTDKRRGQDISSPSNEQASMPKPHQKSLPTPKASPILPNSTVVRKAPTTPQPAPAKKPATKPAAAAAATLPPARAPTGKLHRPSKPKPSKPQTLNELHNVRRAEVAAAKARSSELQPYSYPPSGNSAKSTALPSLGSDDDDDSSSDSGSDAVSESENRAKGKATKMSEKTKSKPPLRDRDVSVDVDTDVDTDDEGSIAA